MPRKVLCTASLLILAACLAGRLSAEPEDAGSPLEQGIRFMGQEDYDQAILTFRGLLLDTAAEAWKADAHFWLAKAYLASGKLEEASRSLEFFITSYPGHPSQPEAAYQKGRLLFLQEDHENAIQVLKEFILRYPQSELVPHAYFWIGESLYTLGHLEEAGRMYGKVIDDYPRSFKVEAARYRLSLIDFKKREGELLKLLKWSHEESLRSAEEFQRREKTYEQALAAYQKKLQDIKRREDGGKGSAAQLPELQKLKEENAALLSRFETLEARIGSVGTGEPLSGETKLQLAQLKKEALDLKQRLLGRLEALTEDR